MTILIHIPGNDGDGNDDNDGDDYALQTPSGECLSYDQEDSQRRPK